VSITYWLILEKTLFKFLVFSYIVSSDEKQSRLFRSESVNDIAYQKNGFIQTYKLMNNNQGLNLNSDHPNVATSLNNLANSYYSQRKYTKAEPLYIEALEMYKRLFSGDHSDVATSLNNLAALYYNQKRYTEAEPLYIEALGMLDILSALKGGDSSPH